MNLFGRNKQQDFAKASDAELARAAQRGEKRAFVEIVARHQAMVCGIALGILGDFGMSEDAGQEAFLMAWRKILELRDPESLKPWLAQIARNAALMELRRKRGHDELTEELTLADEAPGPDEAAATQEETTLVRETLSRLPETYRLPLILYYREGKSVKAVAESLVLSEAAVKQRLARGREMMQERMSGVIETVLTQRVPNAAFTIAIAVAIGALAAPAAIAAGTFSAAAIGASSSVSASTSVLSLMSTSKALLIGAAIVAVACIPIGYRLAEQSGESAAKKTAAAAENAVSKGPTTEGTNNLDNSALIAEWRELHAKYGTNAQAMPELYKAINGLTDAFRKQALRTALIAEWAEVDPAGGLEFFLGKGRSEDQRRQFIQEWLTRDAAGAVSALLARTDGLDRLPREFLTNVAVALPAKLPEIASRLPKAESYWDKSVENAFAILAQKDLSSAIASAQAVTGPNQNQALAGVAKVWGQADLKAAIDWARTLPDGIDRDEIIRVALVGRAAVDPAGALDNAGEVPAGGRNAYLVSTTGARILQEAANADFGATVAWLAAHPGRFDREDLFGMGESVTERMNAGAADFLSARAADGSLAALVPAVEHSLLNRAAGQREAVWEWLNNQPDSDVVKSIRQEVLTSAAWQEPELALQLVSDLPTTAAGDAEVKELARCLFNGGGRLDRFERLLSESPERLKGPLVEEAFDTVYSYMDDSQKWIGRLALLPDTARPKAMGELGNAWAQQSPEEAADWVASLPAGDGRDRAAGGVAAEWARKDPVAADTWVSLLPQGSERDRAAAGLVSALAEQSPDQAWTWALTIGDDEQRKDALTRAAKGMASRDPNMARRWIANGPFTPEMKAELQVTLDKPIKPARWQ